ncbi:MAG: hypothetical protein U5L03_06025 [Burkholderiaceae bacterium]|nr:hypothetical protein [Burkholderiaceae bacterium]
MVYFPESQCFAVKEAFSERCRQIRCEKRDASEPNQRANEVCSDRDSIGLLTLGSDFSGRYDDAGYVSIETYERKTRSAKELEESKQKSKSDI